MRASSPARARRGALVAAALVVSIADPARSQVLPWEVVVAEIEAGRIRNLAERLNKQHLLYKLRLGDVRKSHLAATAAELDRVLESLRDGNPARSIPEPLTPRIREQVVVVEDHWGPVSRIALASQHATQP